MADDAPIPSSFDSNPDFFDEGRWHKFVRKMKEEPLIPLGCGVTCWALYNAAMNIRKKGDPNKTNRFFRYRLYAQAFTITAMLAGSFYFNADRFKRAEYRKQKKKEEEQEKKEKWIRELEMRDAEDKEWRARLGKIRNLEREAEEMRLVEEKKARDRAAQIKPSGVNDDNRGVIEAIRLQHNASKAKGSRDQSISQEADNTGPFIADIGKEGQSQESGTPESEKELDTEFEKEDKKEDFRPILGETEGGGLFGIGHLKKLYAHLTRDRDQDKKDPPT